MGQREGYGTQETWSKINRGQSMTWLTTVHDGCWKEDKFHGWGRLLEFQEVDELIGIASGIDGNLRYEV